MEPEYSILAVLGCFVLMTIDLGILLIVVRFVVQRRPVEILVRLDEAGRPFLAVLTREAKRLHNFLWPSTVPSERRVSALALCTLALLRVLLGGLLARLKGHG